jgi:predicted ribosomally synthesized peptide with SipW-like signal peptide
MNKKILITSLVAACAFGAVAVGGTYALFTSKAEVGSIAVTTGKVHYAATIDAASLKTYSMDVEQQVAGTFECGGTAAIDGNALTLSKLTPGDKVTFTINITNTSTIKTRYRVSVKNTSGANPFQLTGAAASWIAVDAETNPDAAEISLELPKDAGNEYQGQTYTLTVELEAMQYNALTDVSSADALTAALTDGKSVALTQDVTLSSKAFANKDVDIDLDGHNLTVSGDFPVEANAGHDVTIKNGTIVVPAEHAKSAVLYVNGGKLSLEGVTLAEEDDQPKDHVPVQATHGTLEIVDSTISTNHYYVIATNNAVAENGPLSIRVENSNLKAANDEKDNCAILCNTNFATNLEIKNSIITSDRQALILRTGTAVAEDTTFVTTATYLESEAHKTINNTYLTGSWKSGNEVAVAAVVIGDTSASAYNLNAAMTMKNCTLEAAHKDLGAKKVVMASDGTYAASLTADAASIAEGDIAKIGDPAKITVTFA